MKNRSNNRLKNVLRIGVPVMATLIMIAVAALGQKNPHQNLSYACEDCHSTASFKNVRFDHERTGFELTDSHQDATCTGCHDIANFSMRGQGCVSCHNDVHEAKLGSDCVRCHTTGDWRIMDVEEIHLESDFPIVGLHANIECLACHPGLPRGDILSTQTRCVECHQSQYLEIESPNHVAAGFGTQCQDCHQMDTWRPALLEDHEPFFPIYSGEHRGEWSSCNTCHVSNASYQEFSCLNCHEHQQEKADAAHPGIPGYSYESRACYDCHPDGRVGQSIDHDALHFPIYTGTHMSEWDNCSACHTSPTNRAAFDCIVCHTNPDVDNNHVGMPGYSYTNQPCLDCHPDGTASSFVEHDALYFPVYSGQHVDQWDVCAECHTSPANPTEFDCIACHTNPDVDNNHVGMPGYSFANQACFDCHPDGTASSFVEHDALYFPVYSGAHNQEWSTCAECHTSPANPTAFDCLACHKNPETDNSHPGIPGYSYASQACFDCHADGTASKFVEHDGLHFPIYSGTHVNQWDNCAGCHTSNVNAALVDCLVCHTDPETSVFHQGFPGYAYNTQDCLQCHPDGEAGIFTDHASLFPINSGTHRGEWNSCNDCHIDPNQRSVFSCVQGCHEHPQTDMNDKHKDETGYLPNGTVCMDCHADGNK